MPDPGDTAQGDKGQGAGWSKPSSGGGGSKPSTGGSSMGFSGGTLNGGNNNSGNNWGGGGNSTGPRGPESSWGTRGSPSGGALSGGQLSNPYGRGGGGNVGGALNAGLGRDYTPSVPGGLRGLTGPLGEPRNQPTPYGTNYQTAQMYRAAYPNSVGKYSQERVTNALNEFSKAIPGEADYARYGVGAFPNIARVGLNQIVGGYSPEKMVGGMDTTGMRPATRGYEVPGANSIGTTDNWRDPIKGSAYQTLAASSLQDALFNRGVSPQAQNASNFVAAGTPMVRGVQEVGSPVYGTQYGADPTWGNRIENRNTAALQGPILSNNRTEVAGVLSAPEATAPIRVAQAGMGVLGGLFGSTSSSQPTDEPSGQPLNAPYSNLFDKTDRLDVATNTVPSWNQSTYTGPATTVPGSTVANTVPSWQQSSYTGPIQTVMSTPSVAPSQQGENIAFPIDPRAQQTWGRVATNFGNAVFPGLGTAFTYAANKDVKQLQDRWPSMTNAERQAVIDKWSTQGSRGSSNVTTVIGGKPTDLGDGGDGPNYLANNQSPNKPTKDNKPPSSEPVDTTWKQDALKYGFTAEQLKDPEIAAYIKQLWEMGWIPKTANA